jgi:hypothetical protein
MISSSLTTREDVKVQGIKTTSLLSANKLEYESAKSLSAVIQRRMISNPSTSNSYTSGSKNMSININAGDSFVSGRDSYLTFDLKVTAAAGTQHDFGSGSACNIFDQIVIYHSNSTEIERLDSFNLYRRFIDRNTEDAEFFKTKGAAMGYKVDSNAPLTVDGTPYTALTTSQTFNIPLSKLSGLFDLDVLLPNFIMSGMRIEFSLATAETAIRGKVGGAESYELTNVAIVLDSLTLSDSTEDAINKLSAQKGLELTWKSYGHVRKNLTVNTLNVSSDKSVSRSIRSFALLRTEADIVKGTKDSLIPMENCITSYGWRLGSNFFPAQKLTNRREMYTTQLNSFKSPFKHKSAGVTYNQFIRIPVGADNDIEEIETEDTKAGPQGGRSESAACVVLERSDILNLSGLSVSGSRQLSLNATVDSNARYPASKVVDLFTEHVMLCSLWLFDKIILKM